uniref:Probable phosphoheptose isomerase n=1 Tax=uncultured marine thaumarchaeote AD1000_82_B05 TaxID=1455944 RepID=A0A075FZN7_9ARCH|nr:phosphoheptose isomerase (gmhA, lpcA) [uncultured marine thaumarchaeote AD1000_82_B05]
MADFNFVDEINTIFDDSIEVITKSKNLSEKLNQSAIKIISCLKNNGKVILFGNGGSAADAQHMAAELIGRFKIERESISAIALTTDTSVITSIGNDYDFNKIFSRQCESLVNENDVVIAISTSGNSDNVINGVLKAKEKGSFVIGLTGNSGGKLKSSADILLDVPSDDTGRIQEGHRVIIHSLCELIEKNL